MTEGTTGSTVPRRQLGRYLRDLRNRSRLTVRTAAAQLEWSETKIWRIETGQTALRSLDVETMCRVYGAPTDATEALTALAKESKARGWWHAYADTISDDFHVYFGLEAAATHFSWYQCELIPGLLQTEDYARTVFRIDNAGVDDREIERRIDLRMARQAVLTRITATPTFDFVLNEAVLRRPVGGTAVMVRQLERLVDANDLPNVSIRVVPFSVGLHHGAVAGPFVILRFPVNSNGQESEPPTVYAENLTGAVYLDKPNEIERYAKAFANMCTVALDETASSELISQAATELGA
jgi:hypothetical protein